MGSQYTEEILPPGCTREHTFYIDIPRITDEIYDWYQQVGGSTKIVQGKSAMANLRNNLVGVGVHPGPWQTRYVRYGTAKWTADTGGRNHVRLHFNVEDVAIATMFLLACNPTILSHNIPESGESQ